MHELALQPGESDRVKRDVQPMLNLLEGEVLGTQWPLLTPSSHSQDYVNNLSPQSFNIFCVSRSPLPGKTHLTSVALLRLVRGQVMVREAGKGKEGEIGVEAFGQSAAEAVPIQMA